MPTSSNYNCSERRPQLEEVSRTVPMEGAISLLSQEASDFIARYRDLCKPSSIYVCNGSEGENNRLCSLMKSKGMLRRVTHPDFTNCWSARTDPCDVARLESKTFICTPKKEQVVPDGAAQPNATNMLARWMLDEEMDEKMAERLAGCMAGRTMYVIPFSMGPLGSPQSKIGVQLTDSPYVVASMRIMTRMGTGALEQLSASSSGGDFVRCVHSVGRPDPSDPVQIEKAKMRLPTWPCDPDRVLVAHFPHRREVISYGSGYGGNSLLAKKCFALRIASWLGQEEGWLAEHMLILRIKNPEGRVKYFVGAFPSACGKTNLAMMQPALPGWEVKCIGDDIAWLKFDQEGKLRAINPENGFFGVAPGTSSKTNPNAMKMVHRNTIFTNVAFTEEGDVYWEGMDSKLDFDSTKVISWRGIPYWQPGMSNLDGEKITAAHPNSRFCTPVAECPVVDPLFNDPQGVPIDAIIFGGRRPDTVPLVYEAFDWAHGVFLGSAMRSETTKAAADVTEKMRHDPFAMRPFFGYNFGKYLSHWLGMKKEERHMPGVFHVNWFRRGEHNEFLWPGFGENIRVLEWIFRRTDGDDSVARSSPIGLVPSDHGLNLEGLEQDVDMSKLLDAPLDLWLQEEEAVRSFLEGQLGTDMPPAISDQLDQLRQRLQQANN